MSHRDEAPSCNGSQQESQKLTGAPLEATPRTDAKERESESFCTSFDGAKRHAHYGWKFARQLERELLSKTKELEEARKDAERIDLRRLNYDITETVAKGLHYLENVEKVSHLKTAEEVSNAVDGGVERYMDDPIYHAKVQMLAHQIMRAIDSALHHDTER
jgi:hypothetical protein